MNKIHVGFLVSYDYELLKKAIPFVYNHSDKIFLALDANFNTWKGEQFVIEDSFFDWLKSYDKHSKIIIYRDDFYIPGLSSMQCEVRERKLLSEKMGLENWCIQLDADEYFINFNEFTKYLLTQNKLLNSKKGIQIAVFLYNIYKKVDEGFLVVSKPTRVLVTTNKPEFKVGRKCKQQIIYKPFVVLHECLSRTEEELKQKLDNWGHDTQVNSGFMEKWKSVNASNYKQMQDFFYIEPEKWKSLELIKAKNIEGLSETLNYEEILPSKSYIFGKNFGQWFKFLFK